MTGLLLLDIVLQIAGAKPATLRGRVAAEDTGTPVKRALVKLQTSSGGPAYTTTTSADGSYEISNIPIQAGVSYGVDVSRQGYVSASKTTGAFKEGETRTGFDLALTRTSLVSGAVKDNHGEPVPSATVQLFIRTYFPGRVDLRRSNSAVTDDLGNYRIHDVPAGRYYVQAFKRSSPFTAVPNYALALYPDSSSLAGAQVLKVASGQDLPGIDIVMHESPVFRVRGRVVDLHSGQAPGGGSVILSPEDWAAGSTNVSSEIKPDGTFLLNEVPPDHYVMRVIATGATTSGKPLTANKSIDVTDHDIINFVATVGVSARIHGRVSADGGETPAKLTLQMFDRAAGQMASREPIITRPDGTFELSDVQPGNYAVSAIASPPASGRTPFFFIRGIAVGKGAETEGGIMRVPDDATELDVSIVLDFHTGSLTGNATDSSGKPAAGVLVAAVSADSKRRMGPNAYQYSPFTRTGPTGAYNLSGMIPGDYYLLLWPGKDPSALADSDHFDMIQRYGLRVSVPSSGATSADLKLLPDVQAYAESLSQP